ncbi:hypothetical protein ACFL59_05560, partial [Planctomycetota bacterium]
AHGMPGATLMASNLNHARIWFGLAPKSISHAENPAWSILTTRVGECIAGEWNLATPRPSWPQGGTSPGLFTAKSSDRAVIHPEASAAHLVACRVDRIDGHYEVDERLRIGAGLA